MIHNYHHLVQGPGSVPIYGAGKKESSGTGLHLSHDMNESMWVELFLFWLIDMGYIRIYFVPLILSSDVCAAWP